MKILYIALKYDYGNSKRGYGFEHYNFYDSLVKMDGGAHEIVYFPFDEIMGEIGRDEMNKQLIETVRREKPALCFFFLFTDEIKPETIREITQKSGAITFNWFADDHWRFDNFSKYYAPLFHWIGTTDSQAPAKYKYIGYKNAIKTQWACNHFLYKPPAGFSFKPSDYKYDATFVGQPHSNRRKVVEEVRKSGVDIQCWGIGWKNGRIEQDDMIKLFAESKININLSKGSVSHNLFDFARIFLWKRSDGRITLKSPLAWIDNAKSLINRGREQIKGRNFEVPGSGGFLLTSDADNMRDYYEDGKEVVIFKNTQDLIEKIKYYLARESERIAIAKAGYGRTLREHTYEKRFNEIFRIIFNK